MDVTRIDLPAPAPGTARHLVVQRFGAAGARPKAYLQAALHADELPGVLVLHHLARLLAEAEAAGRVLGEVVLVPLANPIGLAQRLIQSHPGRFDLNRMTNFNRDWPDFLPALTEHLGDRLGSDAAANVALIRRELAAQAADLPALDENDALRRTLYGLALDADLVLDLHCDLEAVTHLYLGTPLWPGAADLAAAIGAEAVLLAETSGGNPFDEAFSAPWWQLARTFPDRPIPQACLAATIEYRGLRDVEDRVAAADAAALLDLLVRRGLVAGEAGPLPALRCAATPLDVLGAETEGQIGYVIELELDNAIPAQPTVAIVTRTEVDAADPSTLTLSAPVKNTKQHAGRPLAWAVGSRVLRTRSLARGPATTDELDDFELGGQTEVQSDGATA